MQEEKPTLENDPYKEGLRIVSDLMNGENEPSVPQLITAIHELGNQAHQTLLAFTTPEHQEELVNGWSWSSYLDVLAEKALCAELVSSGDPTDKRTKMGCVLFLEYEARNQRTLYSPSAFTELIVDKNKVMLEKFPSVDDFVEEGKRRAERLRDYYRRHFGQQTSQQPETPPNV